MKLKKQNKNKFDYIRTIATIRKLQMPRAHHRQTLSILRIFDYYPSP